MDATSEEKLEQVLTEKLDLDDPEFYLKELPGGKLSGNIVSDTFAGMDDAERQRRIWEALDAEFQGDSTQIVSTLLAYTKAEWNVDLADA